MGSRSRYHNLPSYRYEQLLAGITVTLPFLGVRAAYVILSAWSSSNTYGTPLSSNPTLAKFNPITGD